MKVKVLKTEAEYEAALAQAEQLMDAAPGSSEEEALELWAFLIEAYEAQHVPIDLPDPIEAIQFRMQQEGLTRKDMRKYLGSQSKVSEVLNRKRPLSLTMIRNLHEGLGIPAEVLLQDPGKEISPRRFNHRTFPFGEMFKRGYFSAHVDNLTEAREFAEELLADLFSVFGGHPPDQALCRKSDVPMDENALLAWQARALQLAKGQDLPSFEPAKLDQDFLREVAGLSYYSQGPSMARELLHRQGIHLVLLRHLPKTYLDGACFHAPTGNPVVGLTLRHDRLDNFWFTLLHELAHLRLHLSDNSCAFFDNTEHPLQEDSNPQEAEADLLATESLIPSEAWRQNRSALLHTENADDLIDFAEELRISPAIVAGRVRWESGDFTRFTKLVGNRKVRQQFPDYE